MVSSLLATWTADVIVCFKALIGQKSGKTEETIKNLSILLVGAGWPTPLGYGFSAITALTNALWQYILLLRPCRPIQASGSLQSVA